MTPGNLVPALAACSIFLATAGCMGRAPPTVSIGSGFNCLSNPTAFRMPGVVYSVDKRTGTPSTFYDFSSVVGSVSQQPFVDVTGSRTNTVNASVLASALGLPLKASADAKRLYTVSQSFGGTSQTDMDQPTTNRLEDAFFASQALADAEARKQVTGNDYYLVRNVILASDVTYKFDHSVSADIDVTAVPATIGTIEAQGRL